MVLLRAVNQDRCNDDICTAAEHSTAGNRAGSSKHADRTVQPHARLYEAPIACNPTGEPGLLPNLVSILGELTCRQLTRKKPAARTVRSWYADQP